MPIQSNISDLNQRIRAAQIRLVANRADTLLTIASDTLALTKRRIQQTGMDSQGQPFEDYTTPYTKVRQQGGYQINHVDFTITGRMWNSIRASLIENTETRTVVEVSASNQSDQNKLNGQFEKRGNILLPDRDELNFALQAAQERIQNELDNL